MRFRDFLFLLFFAIPSVAAPGFGDIRNLEDPRTKSHFTTKVYRTLPEWQARRETLKRQILVSAGLYPLPEKTPLTPRRFGRYFYSNYTVEKVVIQPFPGFFLAGNLYLPAHYSGRVPGVLVAHGHWKNGRIHDTEDYSVPALCINLAAQGYAVFAYDMLGYNDTRQLKHSFGDTVEEQLWSFSPLGIQLWDSIRALDFLESLQEVNPLRLAITGASGGGTQTFLLAGVDERIRAAAPVDMVSSTFQGDDACEMAPGLRLATNNVEFAALMAPRPLLLVSSTHDWTKNTPREEFPAIRAIYRLYQRENNVANRHIDAPHNYNKQSREAVYDFFNRFLQSGERRATSTPRESEVFSATPESLLVGGGLQTAEALPQQKEIFEAWRAASRRQTDALSIESARSLLIQTLHVEWPKRADMLTVGEQLLLERSGYGDRVPVRWVQGSADARILLVHGHGSVAALNWDYTKELRSDGSAILLLDAYQTGDALAERPPPHGDHLLFHLSDDAQRVQDILTGLAWLGASEAKPIRLVCDKTAAMWCWAAAAVAGQAVRISAPAFDTNIEEREVVKQLFVPGLQRAGGLPMMQRLATEHPVSSDSGSNGNTAADF